MMCRAHLLTAFTGLVLTVLCGATSLLAQDDQPYDFKMPDNLKPFWESYWEAKLSGDREATDEIVRKHRERADECLELILDDLCQNDVQSLHHEARTLAWTLDEVTRSERYITRVRLVLESGMKDRARRYRARRAWWDAIDLEDLGKQSRTFEAWEVALQAYLAVFEEFNDIGDYEMAMMCLSRCEQIERERQRPWERARFLAQVVALGDRLSYRDSVASESKQALDALLSMGVDPTKDKPADLAKKDADLPQVGGRGLEAFAQDSEAESFALARKSPKKGIAGVKLPSLYPAEQYQLWPKTYVTEQGPDKFDFQRAAFLAPWGEQWTLTRSAMFEFGIDSDNDGQVDVSFSASASPSRIEVPGPEGEEPYPLMVAVLSDRELMFGVETNYAPTQAGTRLRFWLASQMEGKVLGTPWKMYDLNMDGKFGPLVENFDDLITAYTRDDHVSYWEPDGVLIGRAKKAIPLSSVMPIGDEFYRCIPSSDGTSVEMRKMHIATGKVKLDVNTGRQPDFLLARAIDEELEGAIFDILPPRKGGAVSLPAGDYQIVLGALSTGKRTSLDMARIYSGDSEPFKISAGVTTELEVGAPYKLTFKTRMNDEGESEVDSRTLRIFGQAGEEYTMLFDEALQPDVSVQNESGKPVVKGDSMRANGIEQWQNNATDRDNVLWFPMEYSIEVPRGSTYKFKLQQKKHSLLGGPFESDWIQ
ncbi:MAG: hypothetical protein P8N09_07780 [Planctomycetota bacterium]|nr:hypothetical protein [Planctomycetota bacterium]